MRRLLTTFLPLVGTAALLVFLETTQPSDDTTFWRAVFDCGHIPLFGVIALLLLFAARTALGARLSPSMQFVVAGAAALVIGALSEIVQIGTARDADIFDFFRDLVGIVGALTLYGSITIKWPLRQVRFALAAFALLAALSCMSQLELGVAYWQRDSDFPKLTNFERGWSRSFVFADSCSMEWSNPPGAWTSAQQKRVLRVEYMPLQYTGLIIQDIIPDWRGKAALGFSAYSESAHEQRLNLRIDDKLYSKHADDRFNRVITVYPGANVFTIPIGEIERRLATRMLDLSKIKRIVLFSASEPRERFTVYFGDFELE